MKAIFFNIISIFIATMLTAQSSTEKINFLDLKKIVSETKTTVKTTQQINGQEMEMNMETLVVGTNEINILNKDSVLIKSNINRLKLKTVAMGNATSYDSEDKNDAGGQVDNMVRPALNKTCSIYVNEYAKILPGATNKKASAEPNMLEALGVNGQQVSELFLSVPKGIQAGTTWTETVNTDKDNNSTITYTLKSVTNDEALVSFNGVASNKKTQSMQGMEILSVTTAKTNGEIAMQLSTGKIVTKTTNKEESGTAEAMGQSIAVSSFATIVTVNR